MFRIILSHDIDHLGVKDHYRDLVVPKFVVLNVIGLIKHNIRLPEFFCVLKDLAHSLLSRSHDSWCRLDEWLDLEEANGIRSTWFVACSSGTTISYSTGKARRAIDKIKSRGHIVGLHSQHRHRPERLPDELAHWREVYGIDGPVPVRMHYLASRPEAILEYRNLFTFDSSIYDETAFSTGEDFERPINIMDTYFCGPIKQNRTLEQSKARTLEIFESARQQDKEVMIDLHQRSLSPCFPRYREYILWLYSELANWPHS